MTKEQHITDQTISKKTLSAILATALLAFSGVLSETSMNVTYAKLQGVFHLPLGTLQWITTGYLLIVAIVMTASAILKHNYPERSLFMAGVIAFMIGSILAAVAPSFTVLMIGRIFQGIGTGIGLPLMFNLIIERIPVSKIGLFMGLGGLIVSLAPAFGPTYGGVIIANWDWHILFVPLMIFPILAFIFGLFIENSEKKEKRSIDIIAFLLLAITLTTALLAISSLENGRVNLIELVIFIIALILFIWKSLTAKDPFLDIRLFAKPAILFGLLPFFIYQFANLASNFIIPNFLQVSLGTNASLAGFSLLPGTLIGAIAAPAFGKLYDEKGAKLSLYLGNIIFVISLIFFALFTSKIEFIAIVVIYTVFTIGKTMAFNNMQAVSITDLPPMHIPDVTALFQVAQTFAGAFGTAIAAVIIAQAPGKTESAQMMTGTRYLFILLLVLSVIIFPMFVKLFTSITHKKS